MEKQISLNHGISINGELQVYKIKKYVEGGKVKHEVIDKPYSPKDVHKMGDFDVRSQLIVEALYLPEIIEEVQEDIARYLSDIRQSGFFEVVRYDRMMDDLHRIPIRRVTELIENGKVISKKYHRSWIMPGGTFLDKDILSKTLAEKFHTPENIEVFQAAMAKNSDKFEAGLNGEPVVLEK